MHSTRWVRQSRRFGCTDAEIIDVLGAMSANWAHAVMTEDKLDLYCEVLANVPYIVAMEVLQDDYGHRPWPPTPYQLRLAALERMAPPR